MTNTHPDLAASVRADITSTPPRLIPDQHASVQQTSAESTQPVSEKRIRIPYPIRMLIVCVLMLVNALSVVLFYPVTLIPGFNHQPDVALEWWGTVMRLIPVGMSILVVWLMMRFVDHRPLRESGLRFTRWSVPCWLLGIAGGVAAIFPAAAVLTNAGLLRPEPDYFTGSTPLMTLVGVIVLGLFMQGFPEELLWRGYGLQTMRSRPILAVVVSALVFGAMHFLSGAGQQDPLEYVLYCFAATGIGILAGTLAVTTRSLWAAVGVHFGVHLAFYFCYLFDAGTGPALWLTEGLVFWALAVGVFSSNKQAFRWPIALVR